ncbi:MAG TPA: DNA repair protein RecN [Nitrolancea sp.]|nr:DNA repair protein RecN [Nitrolancea sp.]
MLLELTIRNFAIIRDLHIVFSPGFNALTGETGAGKSIIIDALGAVLGARVSSDLVRSGSSNAWVEALFDARELEGNQALQSVFTEHGIQPEDGNLILSRDINANGRSVARVNGRTVTAATLATIGGFFVDIHGQSEHLSLLRPAVHLDLLDHFAGTGEHRQRFADLVREYGSIQRRIEQIQSTERERAHRTDLLQFQVEEIGSASLEPGEDDALDRQRTVLANSERLALLAAEAYQLLDGGDEASGEPISGALDKLRLVVERVEELSRIDRENEPLASQMREVLYLLEDHTLTIRSYSERVEADPGRLAEIEDRLALIKQLKRKYGATLDDVINYLDSARAELDELQNSEEHIEELREASATLRRRLGSLAGQISSARQTAAVTLVDEVERSIAELNMGRSRFQVSFSAHGGTTTIPVEIDGLIVERSFDPTGTDRVEFLIAPNAGEAPKPLGKVASGGEMARLMLALKSILSTADDTPTLVFDEVDVGVGGRSGQPVGEKLWRLGGRHQVLVISHLPQVAAFAESHYKITKLDREGRTETRIDLLEIDERIDELAAMLDGQPPTPESRENARAMLERIEAWKRERVVSTSIA